MGRRDYITGLALGRSVYEDPDPASSTVEEIEDVPQNGGPSTVANIITIDDDSPSCCNNSHNSPRTGEYTQRYDFRSRPINLASSALVRASVRAHNDVLAAVGACVEVGKDRKLAEDDSLILTAIQKLEGESVKAVIAENEIGLIISSIDTCLVFLTHWASIGIRFKLQTFGMYSEMSFPQMLHFQRSRFGFVGMCYANVPTFLAHMIFSSGQQYLLNLFEILLVSRLSNRTSSMKRKKYLEEVVSAITSLASFASFLLLAPLKVHSLLQLLSIIPPRPVFPNVLTLIPFSTSSYIQLPAFPSMVTLDSTWRWGLSVLTSPVAILWVVQLTRNFVLPQMYSQVITRIPKPDDPDIVSRKAAVSDQLDVTILPGLQRPSQSEDFAQQLQHIRNWFFGFLGVNQKRINPKATLSFLHQIARRVIEGRQGLRQEHQANPAVENSDIEPSTATLPYQSELDSDANEQTTLAVPNVADTQVEQAPISTSEAAPSLPSSSSVTQPVLRITIPASSEREEYERISREIEMEDFRRPPDDSRSVSPLSLTTRLLRRRSLVSQRQDSPSAENSKRQLHRVSCLSNYPAENLANRIVMLGTKLLLLPLQAVLLRTVALDYLTRQGGNTEGLWRPWGGNTGIWGGGYMRNMVISFALETTLSMGIWEVGVLSVRALGKYRYGWMTLRTE